MEANTIQNLLTQISAISKKYAEITRVTGENFNIFNVLNLSTKEVRTHSAFLAELLNINGSHGQGDVFLKLFVTQMKIENFETNNAKTEVEKYIGITQEETGGRIDLIITDKNNIQIIIENKIYAGDQENQLLRYYKYGNNKKHLLYLTLDGSDASEWSTGKQLKKGVDYQLLSYKDDIIVWLENCKKESVNQPILRETITQYINLIKQLTNQSINQNMATEIVKTVVKYEENIKIAFEIEGSLDSIKVELIKELNEQLELLASKKNCKLTFDIDASRKCTGFTLNNTALDNSNLAIRFEFEEKKYWDLCYGYFWKDSKIAGLEEQRGKLKPKFDEKFGESLQSDTWPCYIEFGKKYNNWRAEAFVDIKNGEMLKVFRFKPKCTDLI